MTSDMTPLQEQISDLLPLREPTFFILLSLVPGEKHGYAILKDVESLSNRRLRLSTGTLYEGLARMLDQGLIDRVDETRSERSKTPDVSSGVKDRKKDSVEGGKHPGRPRKLYVLTKTGREVLRAETHRMHTLVGTARLRLKEAG